MVKVMVGASEVEAIWNLNPEDQHIEASGLAQAEGAAAVTSAYTVPADHFARMEYASANQMVRVTGDTTTLDDLIHCTLDVDGSDVFSLEMLAAQAAAGSHQSESVEGGLVLPAASVVTATIEFQGTAAGAGRARQRLSASFSEFDA